MKKTNEVNEKIDSFLKEAQELFDTIVNSDSSFAIFTIDKKHDIEVLTFLQHFFSQMSNK